ncbi:MAG: ribonuclease H-like domain-containing protein [Methanomicrobiales archaeon]
MEHYQLKKKLLVEYQDKKLDDLEGIGELETPAGPILNIRSSAKINFTLKDKKEALENLISDLKIIKGIGQATERKLKSEGYHTLNHLMEHPRYGKASTEIMETFSSENNKSIAATLTDRYPHSHPQILNTCSLCEKEDFVFMDIETLGLKSRPIILIGEAFLHKNRIIVNQYLLDELNQETGILYAHLSGMSDESVYVTFNGRSFDVPYIKDRLNYFQIDHKLDHHHLDLLHFSRRLWGNILPNCQLTTIEEHLLGMKRVDDVPGSLVPDFYKTYMETGNIGPLIPIIEHNREDVISLARIISKMHKI